MISDQMLTDLVPNVAFILIGFWRKLNAISLFDRFIQIHHKKYRKCSSYDL